MSVYYLDSSAILKLFLNEPEREAMYRWTIETSQHSNLISCDVAFTEVLRSIRRTDDKKLEIARQFLFGISRYRVTSADYQSAASLQPVDLRTLDALHLASALAICEEEDFFVSYDQRLLHAAKLNGLQTLSPK